MLEGLTIISTEHIIVRGFGWCTGGYILFGLALLGVIVAMISYRRDSDLAMLLFLGGAITAIVASVWGIGVCSTASVKNEYDRWKVLVDDNVKMNEFNERYNILSVDGNIYEIMEWKDYSGDSRPNKYFITVEEEPE